MMICMKKNSFSVIDTKRTAERIKCMMEWKHFRPRDIQEYLGLACVQTVYHWLSGAAIPNIDHLYALSQLFQVKIDDILIGERKPLPISRSQAYYLMEYYKRLTRLGKPIRMDIAFVETDL